MADRSNYASELLVVCAVCKRVRDHEGRWIPPDGIPSRPEQKISHAVCPDCGREKYPGYVEQRRFPREFVQIFVEVKAGRDDGSSAAVEGVTVNISRGGMLALLLERGPIEVRKTCEIRFKDAAGVLAPERTTGVVVRAAPRGPDHEVAIDFGAPLETLSAPTS